MKHIRHIAILCALGLMTLLPSLASAAPLHTVTPFSPITGSGSGEPLEFPMAAAVDESNGNIFVADQSQSDNSALGTIQILNFEGGAPTGVASPFKIDVGFRFRTDDAVRVNVGSFDNSASSPSKGTLYVAAAPGTEADKGQIVQKYVRNPATEKYELAGTLQSIPPLNNATAVTVDDSGNVYVSSEFSADSEFGKITKFSPTGTQLALFELPGATRQPRSLAVDSVGDLFVETENRGVFKFPVNGLGEWQASNFIKVPVSGEALGRIAVDRATNTLFVGRKESSGDTGVVTEFDASSLLERGSFAFPGAVTSGSIAIAVNSSAGLIYAVQGSLRQIAVATLNGPTIPDTGATDPTGVSAAKATLNGVVNPQGLAISECKFEFNGESLPCEGALPADSSGHAVSAQVSGLKPHSRYTYRLVAGNANGTNHTQNKSFDTEPIVRTEPVSGTSSAGATLEGLVRPEGAPLSKCQFEYGLTKEYGSTVPCAPEAGAIPSDFSAHAVTAAISGLTVGTVYHYRIVAAGGLGEETGEDVTFTTLGPTVDSVSAGHVTDTSATFEALVNPHGKPATYHFEYGTQGPCSANPCTSIPVPDASAGSVNAIRVTCGKEELESGCVPDAAVSQVVKGLAPRTTYYFRVVVTNPDGTARSAELSFITYGLSPSFGACPNDAFRTGLPSAMLPDCRAYEQATPVDKNGNDIGGQRFVLSTSPAGDGVTTMSKGGLPGGEGAENYPFFLSQRGASTWSTQGLLPPPSFGDQDDVINWTPDLAYSFSVASFADSDLVGGFDNALLLRSSASHAVKQITPYLDKAEYAFAAASTGDSKLFFEAVAKGVKLTPDAATGKQNLYLYEPASEEVSLVGVLPNGTAPSGGSFAGPFDWWRGGGVTRGGALGPTSGFVGSIGYFMEAAHPISANGSKAYFTAGETGQIYLREGIGGENPETLHVSASQRSAPDPDGAMPATFLAASTDGSRAFFMSCEKLTDDSTAHSTAAPECDDQGQGQDLYLYDAENQELTDITADTGDPLGAQVQGFIGASDDGSYAYFVANGDLDGGGPAEPGNCQHDAPRSNEFRFEPIFYEGQCNLYAWHDGTITFAGRLTTDVPARNGVGRLHAGLGGDAADWMPSALASTGAASIKTARVSANGKAVFFRSLARLTAYDNRGPHCEIAGVCAEFYRYRFGDSAPTCVTCNPIGTPPTESPTLEDIEAGINKPKPPMTARVFSASGDQAFFQTSEKLVAADVNGDDGCPGVSRPSFPIPSCQDVYEWEAVGAGSCDQGSSAYSAQNAGCIYLLSSGTSPDPSYLADASASGDDAFILTSDQLVPQDKDRLYDAYDVSVDGGLASQNQPVSPPPCEGESCRGAGSAPPGGPSAGSATFSGPGDPTVKRCPKGKVRKGSKCVKHHKPRHGHSAHKRGGRGKKGGRK